MIKMSEYNKWTVKALKEYAKEKNIKIPTGSKKAEIVTIIEQTPIQIEKIEDSLTNRRQNIIERVIKKCKEVGEKKIIDFFEQRNKNNKLKQTFDVYQLDLKNPSLQDLRFCLKYFQVTQKYNKGDKLLINQMITQPKYIDPEYIDERKRDMDYLKDITEFQSATYDIPLSKTKKK